MTPMGLDIVIRLYDPSELPRLDHCVFSLLGQSLDGACEELRVHLMLRRFSFDEVRAVRTAIQALRRLDETTIFIVHNWQISEPFDLRVPLLNWGLEVTNGRYFTCLDVGDVLVPGAYARLLERLRTTQAVLALGGMATQLVRWWGDVVLPMTTTLVSDDKDLPPLFVIDRTRLPLQDLVFRVDQSFSEITAFVQHIRAFYPVDTEYEAGVLGLHQVPC